MSDLDGTIASLDKLKMDPEDIMSKMNYINMQMDQLSEEHRDMFSKEFQMVTKSLKTLRKILNKKQAEGLEWYEFNYYFVGCAFLLVLIFG